MGMAASQGRFLSLTARKSNVEYEGQQVNQQRTVLANQTSALTAQMLQLSVPTPPDATLYYNDQYVFVEGDKNFEIISGLGCDTTIVRETTTETKLYNQPLMNATLTYLNGLLKLNGNQLNLLNDVSSKNQIRTILDNGTSTDKPPFMCSTAATAKNVTNDSATLSNSGVQKYINKIKDIASPATDKDFQSNYKKGIPSYYVEDDGTGKLTYTLLTDNNYETLIEKSNASNAKIVQQERDGNNKPVKVAITQDQCNSIKGLEFYVMSGAERKLEKATALSSGQKYLPSVQIDKDELLLDTTLNEQIENGTLVLFKKVENVYTRITSAEELNDLTDEATVLKVVNPENTEIPQSNLVGIPVSNSDTTDYGVPYYVYNETGTSFELTQAMWNAAKSAGNKELMDYYIESLDFSDSDNAKNNRLYYYIKNSIAHYVQSYYTSTIGEGETAKVDIEQEFYEHTFDVYKDQSFTNCIWTKDNSTARFTSFTGTNPEGNTKTYNLTYSKIKDDDAYDQAVMDYEYRKSEYEKAVADINAKTESIQQQDKTLELRLRSLDTEQEALKQELDAVKKVIEENIQKTFDTFK